MDVQYLINKEGGEILHSDYNRLSKQAENRLMYWITGDIRGGVPPEPYLTQKNKDFISQFITSFKSNLDSNGRITRPDNYYQFENMFALSLIDTTCDDPDTDCDSDEITDEIKSTPIELVDGSKFTHRLKSNITGLRPTIKRPITKQIGKEFEIAPKDVAAVTLEYIRYPVYANIVSTDNTTFRDEEINEAASTNYEWDENAREMLIFIITDLYSNHIREKALKEHNAATGKTING